MLIQATKKYQQPMLLRCWCFFYGVQRDTSPVSKSKSPSLNILATSKKYDNPIIVSVDKDMRSVPCTLLAGDDMELITKRKADRHWMIQALTGDSTDNYFGIDKVGPVTAEKILGEAKTLEQMWEKVVEAYEKKKYNFADAVLNAQLARILRDGDFDFDTGEVSLWTP